MATTQVQKASEPVAADEDYVETVDKMLQGQPPAGGTRSSRRRIEQQLQEAAEQRLTLGGVRFDRGEIESDDCASVAGRPMSDDGLGQQGDDGETEQRVALNPPVFYEKQDVLHAVEPSVDRQVEEAARLPISVELAVDRDRAWQREIASRLDEANDRVNVAQPHLVTQFIAEQHEAFEDLLNELQRHQQEHLQQRVESESGQQHTQRVETNGPVAASTAVRPVPIFRQPTAQATTIANRPVGFSVTEVAKTGLPNAGGSHIDIENVGNDAISRPVGPTQSMVVNCTGTRLAARESPSLRTNNFSVITPQSPVYHDFPNSVKPALRAQERAPLIAPMGVAGEGVGRPMVADAIVAPTRFTGEGMQLRRKRG